MANPFVMVRRFAFSRGDVVRRVVKKPGRTCDWCGRTRLTGNLFQYGWLSDDRAEPTWDVKNNGTGGRVNALFCSIGCRDTYFDLPKEG